MLPSSKDSKILAKPGSRASGRPQELSPDRWWCAQGSGDEAAQSGSQPRAVPNHPHPLRGVPRSRAQICSARASLARPISQQCPLQSLVLRKPRAIHRHLACVGRGQPRTRAAVHRGDTPPPKGGLQQSDGRGMDCDLRVFRRPMCLLRRAIDADEYGDRPRGPAVQGWRPHP